MDNLSSAFELPSEPSAAEVAAAAISAYRQNQNPKTERALLNGVLAVVLEAEGHGEVADAAAKWWPACGVEFGGTVYAATPDPRFKEIPMGQGRRGVNKIMRLSTLPATTLARASIDSVIELEPLLGAGVASAVEPLLCANISRGGFGVRAQEIANRLVDVANLMQRLAEDLRRSAMG